LGVLITIFVCHRENLIGFDYEQVNSLFCEKYRPQVIDDCILPDETKKTFKEFVAKGEIPNLLLAGPPGIGKTTIAKALCNELGADFYVINGSDEGRFLDTVRNQAKNFASTVSLTGSSKHKVIIIDEADNTGNDVQLLLRANIETFYNNCRFIFTCNYKNKIIEPLHSRCAVIDFTIKGKQRVQLAGNFFERLRFILDQEKIEYDQKVVAELVSKHFPDFRRVLNEIQRYSTGGKIDAGILASFSDISVNELIKHLKEKNFTEVRKWVSTNLDNDSSVILRRVYDSLYDALMPASIPAAVLIIAKYQYQIAFVADQEINLLAALTEVMVECEFK
jgi:DNA polymerase III delta prime subunit